jgi:5-(carboxyamino)imidazole ribonucleotide mutase
MIKIKSKNLVGIIMGSKSDWKGTMEHCSDTLKQFDIKHDVKVISAHRTPKRLHKFIKEAEKNKMEVIIAAAGMSAHLAGVAASLTTIPVLGVPTESKLKGLDSLLSTVQMPSGIPVGTLAIGKAGAINAALLAISILSVRYNAVKVKLKAYRNNFEKKIPKKPF